MKAVQWSADTNQVRLVEVPRPGSPGQGQVNVKVAYAGICGTDLKLKWFHEEGVIAGKVIPGHEMSGTVVEVGSDVRRLHVGQRVTISPGSGCGRCGCCQAGREHFCPDGSFARAVGFQLPGGMAEFVQVDRSHVHPLPDTVSLRMAVLSEPMACICRGFDQLGSIPQDAKILIIGAGIAGLLFASILHHRGYRAITMTQRSEKRRTIAQNLGLGYKVCHPDSLDAEAKEKSFPGFDIIIECSGNPIAIEQAFPMLANSGKMVIYSIPVGNINIRADDIFRKELTIIGSRLAPYTFPKAIALVKDMAGDYIDFEKLNIQKYSLEDCAQAYDALNNHDIVKGVFKIGGEE